MTVLKSSVVCGKNLRSQKASVRIMGSLGMALYCFLILLIYHFVSCLPHRVMVALKKHFLGKNIFTFFGTVSLQNVFAMYAHFGIC